LLKILEVILALFVMCEYGVAIKKTMTV